MLRRYTLTGHTYLNRTPAAEHLSLIGFKAFSVIDGIGTRISSIGFKGFLVLDGLGTINHTRTTGPVVFLHRSSATKVVVTRLSLIGFRGFSVIGGFGTHISLIGFKGFLVLDGLGTINHTRTTGPVVFLHRSSATKVVVTRLSLIGFRGFSVIGGFGTHISLIGFKGALRLTPDRVLHCWVQRRPKA